MVPGNLFPFVWQFELMHSMEWHVVDRPVGLQGWLFICVAVTSSCQAASCVGSGSWCMQSVRLSLFPPSYFMGRKHGLCKVRTDPGSPYTISLQWMRYLPL